MIIILCTADLYNQFRAANLPSDVTIGTPVVDANGLRAVCHPFCEQDIQRTQELFAVEIVSGDVRLIANDILPADWVPVSDTP